MASSVSLSASGRFSPSSDPSVSRWEKLLDRIELPLGSSPRPSEAAMQKTMQLFRSELLTQVRRADDAEEKLRKLQANHATFPKG